EPPARLASREHRRCAHARDPPCVHDPPAADRRTARRGRRAGGPDPYLGGARRPRRHHLGPRPGPHHGDGSHTMSTTDACEFTPPAAESCEIPAAAPTAGAWKSPSQQERFALLRRSRSIAIVGASSNPARASYFVGTYLLSSSPYDVYFVNPMADEILGQPAHKSLADLPVVPDIVDVFRKDSDLPGVAQEAVDVGAKALWLQLGSWNEEAAAIAEG